MGIAVVSVDRRLHDMVAAIDAAVIIVDASGMIDIANDQTATLLGRRRDAIENVPVTALFSTPANGGLVAKIRNAIRGDGKPWTETVMASLPDGGVLHIAAKFSLVQPAADHISVLALLTPVEVVGGNDRDFGQSTAAEVRSMVSAKAGRFSAGHLEMIGLEQVRSTLGERWEKLAERVYDIADNILRARLSREDVFRRDADGNYVICFASLSGEQAWFKASALGQEICEALIGKEADDKLAEFKLDDATRQRMLDVKSGTFEIEIGQEELDEIPDVMGLIRERVGKAADQLRQNAGSLLAELSESSTVRFVGVKTLTGRALPLRIATFDPKSLKSTEQLRGIYCDSPKLLAQLDGLLLGNALERLICSNPATAPVTVVAVHFSTLVDRACARAYFDILGNADSWAAKSLILRVQDIPSEMHRGRITEVLRHLRNYSRVTSIRLSRPTLGNIDLAEARVSVVSFDFRDLTAMYRIDAKNTLRLIGQLRQYKSRIGVGFITTSPVGMAVLMAVKPDFVTYASQFPR